MKTQSILLIITLLTAPISLLAQGDQAWKTEVTEMTRAIYKPYLSEKDAGKNDLPPLMEPEAIAGKSPKGYIAGPLAEALTKYLANPDAMLGYDPLIDAQDWDITDFKVQVVQQAQNEAGDPQYVVVATFKNFGQAREIGFLYWNYPEAPLKGWKLVDIKAKSGADGRSYSVSEDLLNAAK